MLRTSLCLTLLMLLVACHKQEAVPLQERLIVSNALFAVEGSAAELNRQATGGSQQAGEIAFLTSAALLFIDGSKSAIPVAATGSEPGGAPGVAAFQSYFLVTRYDAIGIAKQKALSKPLPVVLLYGDGWPPCFGTARRRATLDVVSMNERSEALVVDDCLRPPNRWGATALQGVSGAKVSVLVDPESFANPGGPHPDLDALNELLQKAGKTQRYGWDRHWISRDDPSLRAAREAAEARPEARGARAQYVVERATERLFVFVLEEPSGSSAVVVRIGADGSSAVEKSPLR